MKKDFKEDDVELSIVYKIHSNDIEIIRFHENGDLYIREKFITNDILLCKVLQYSFNN